MGHHRRTARQGGRLRPLVCLLLLAAWPAAPLAAADAGSHPDASSVVDAPPAWARALAPVSHWYGDDTSLARDRTAAHDEQAWQDTVGGPIFDTTAVGVGWTDRGAVLLLVTRFPERNVLSAGRLVAPADLALDLDGDGAFETAVVMSDVRATGDRGVQRPDTVRKGQVYRVSRWHRPDDLLRHTYGQGWRWRGPDGQWLAQASVPVWMAEGELREDVGATVDWLPHPAGPGRVVRVTLRFADPPPTVLPLVWGTAVCGNDVVFADPALTDDMVVTSAPLVEGGTGSAASAGDRVGADDAPAPDDPGAGAALPRWDVPFNMVFGNGLGRSGSGPSGAAPSGSGGNVHAVAPPPRNDGHPGPRPVLTPGLRPVPTPGPRPVPTPGSGGGGSGGFGGGGNDGFPDSTRFPDPTPPPDAKPPRRGETLPVPAPAAWALLLAGAAILVVLRRCRRPV